MNETHTGERRRPGRPRLFAEPTRVNLLIEAEEYDQLYADAKAFEISIPEAIRRRLRLTFRAA